MITKTDKAEKKKIDWLFPDENQVVTVEDFREMVREAENSGSMTLSEFKDKMASWWQKQL
ncbi:hypothetical protein FACS1894145_2210 [Bacteroidia bacterium]|nr:hypothetical protein FACS1894145_2210 [Bacteroidia bacterium]